jgi:hypothetical protein
MYRNPVPIAKSLYRLSFSLPTLRLLFLLRKFTVAVPRPMCKAIGFERGDYRLQLDYSDDLALGIAMYAVSMKAYLDMRRRWLCNGTKGTACSAAPVNAVRYEDLVAKPVDMCRAILDYCGLPVSLAELAVSRLDVDSQRNSPLAKSLTVGGGCFTEPELTTKSEESFNRQLKQLGLPLIDEEQLVDGTLTVS